MGTGEESACSVLYNRRRWLTAQSSGKQQAVCTAVRAAQMVCPEEGHFVRFQKRKFFAGAMVAVSRVSRQLRCPKVSKGERREAGIQWIQPPKAVSDPEFRQTTSGAHGSANRADCLPRGKPFGAPAGAVPLPGGLTRRLRRGRWGCRPEGGSTFFRRERKYQRKPAARRLREKALYYPF